MNQPDPGTGTTSGSVPVVTIDGPVGSGKGTVAGMLARRLGWNLLDSGSLYRLVALAALRRGLDSAPPTEWAALAESLRIDYRFEAGSVRIYLDQKDVSEALRLEEVSDMASRVAAAAEVRAALLRRQLAARRPPGLVADGRDMGTVVFPAAELKIYLTANVTARAERRYKQLKEKGESVIFSRLLQDLEARDARDQSRSVAPLKAAADAVLIDSTELDAEQVVGQILELVRTRGLGKQSPQ